MESGKDMVNVETGEIVPIAHTPTDLIASGEVVGQIWAKYASAVSLQRQRDLALIKKNCLEEARLAGAHMFYGWGAGKGRVEGPSIDCAMAIMRHFGDLVVTMEPTIDTGDAWIFKAVLVDLQSRFVIEREFRQDKCEEVFGNMEAARKDAVRYGKGQSKAQRNVIVKAFGWIAKEMVAVAKTGALDTIRRVIAKKGWAEAREGAANRLKQLGADIEKVEICYGATVDNWQEEELVKAAGDIAAMEEGRENARTLFDIESKPKREIKHATVDLAGIKPGDPETHQGHELPEEDEEQNEKPPEDGKLL